MRIPIIGNPKRLLLLLCLVAATVLRAPPSKAQPPADPPIDVQEAYDAFYEEITSGPTSSTLESSREFPGYQRLLRMGKRALPFLERKDAEAFNPGGPIMSLLMSDLRAGRGATVAGRPRNAELYETLRDR